MTYWIYTDDIRIALEDVDTYNQVLTALKEGYMTVKSIKVWLSHQKVDLSDTTIRKVLKKLVDNGVLIQYKTWQDTNYFHQTKAGYVQTWRFKD